jgi:hypothetical protein
MLCVEMEEFNADPFFDQRDPSHYFGQGTALIPEPTSEIIAQFSAPKQHTSSYPYIASHNNSLSLLQDRLDLHGNGFTNSFYSSTGMI